MDVGTIKILNRRQGPADKIEPSTVSWKNNYGVPVPLWGLTVCNVCQKISIQHKGMRGLRADICFLTRIV